MKICLDAGHSLVTPGKRIPTNIAKLVGNMHEWEFNSAVANKVALLLNNYLNVETFRSDDISGVIDIGVNQRVKTINAHKPDLVISIHANAGQGTGVETFVYKTTLKGSMSFARIVQTNLVNYTGMKNRGVKAGDFALVRDTHMDAVLLECGFMDTLADAKKLVSVSYRQLVAEAIVISIVETFNLVKKPSVHVKPVTQPKPIKYQGRSIVDYLKSIGINSSLFNRSKLAVQYGIVKYRAQYIGLGSQNTALLKKMRGDK